MEKNGVNINLKICLYSSIRIGIKIRIYVLFLLPPVYIHLYNIL